MCVCGGGGVRGGLGGCELMLVLIGSHANSGNGVTQVSLPQQCIKNMVFFFSSCRHLGLSAVNRKLPEHMHCPSEDQIQANYATG